MNRGWWVCLLAVLPACRGEPASRVAVTDSAGVRVTVTMDSSIVYAELDSVPYLSIGGSDATGPAQFSRIQGIHVDQAHRIWVADGQSNELRIFEGNGLPRPEYLEALDDERRPDSLPAYDRVLAAADGHIWPQVYESSLGAPHEWDVFDGRRWFVGRVEIPAGLYPMVVTTDAVVGVWRDALGVEYVRAYRLTRS